jgi:hypothetical protein
MRTEQGEILISLIRNYGQFTRRVHAGSQLTRRFRVHVAHMAIGSLAYSRVRPRSHKYHR